MNVKIERNYFFIEKYDLSRIHEVRLKSQKNTYIFSCPIHHPDFCLYFACLFC